MVRIDWVLGACSRTRSEAGPVERQGESNSRAGSSLAGWETRSDGGPLEGRLTRYRDWVRMQSMDAAAW